MGRYQTINVCHIISGDLWAGPEVQVHGLLSALASEPELEISIIVMNQGKLATLLKEAGLRVRVIEENRYRFDEIVRRASAELAGRRLDIVHSHRYKENFIAAMLRKRHQVGHLVQTVHGIEEPFTGFKNLKIKLYEFLNDRASRRFDAVVTVSDDIRRQLSSRFDDSKMVTIHNAVDLSRVSASRSADEVRKELGIGADQPVIASVGRMVPVKGFDQFIMASKMISREIPDALFLLVGDGPEQARYEELAAKSGVADKIRFLGYRHDIWDILNCMDLFAMTSYHEGIPVVLLEAMALKRPVVAMSVGGIPEVIEDGVSGRLVEARDIEGFAAACRELLANPERASAIGIEARRRVEGEFSVTVQKDRVLNLYRDLVRSP
jgi:glycosyltransferase involved in cell wall biosynthesis